MSEPAAEMGRPGMMGADLRQLAGTVQDLSWSVQRQFEAITDRLQRVELRQVTVADPRLMLIEQAVADLTVLAETVTSLSAVSTADRLALHQQINDLALTVTQLSGSYAVGSVSTPAIALATNVDVTVTLDRAMPTTTYMAHMIGSAALITNATMSVKSQTKTQVVVTLRAPVAVSAGQTLTVVASP